MYIKLYCIKVLNPLWERKAALKHAIKSPMEKRLAQKVSLINIGRKNAAVDDTHFRNIWLFLRKIV